MRRFTVIAAACLCACSPTDSPHDGITVTVGPTPIHRGNATGANDITVNNGRFAIAFAVDTAPPWGVARGGILDIAPVRSGEIGYDVASLADFMPNRWSSWPTTYQRITVEKASAEQAIIRTVRDWGEVELDTTFTIRNADTKIHILTRMTNRGDRPLAGLTSGYVVWPDGGSLFGVPGLYGANTSVEDDALADWSAAYGDGWALGLYAPFAQIVDYAGRDRYLQHNLGPGESRSFEAWLQIEPSGELAPFVAAEIEFAGLDSGTVTGTVSATDGESVSRSAVVATHAGSPYAWTLGSAGSYSLELPVGEYEMYATGGGYGQSTPQTISITSGKTVRADFNDVGLPGTVSFDVTSDADGSGLDARIEIAVGYKSLIGYFGKAVFFTELDEIGRVTSSIAPGDYVFSVSAGGGFTSVPQSVAATVTSGSRQNLAVRIPVTATPAARGWYSADLHHHSDVLDGFTEPQFVMRSELAAGLDITFLSDHDSVINNAQMQVLAGQRNRIFIPGTEMSPSWAHFNAYPLEDGKTVDVDTGRVTVQELFTEARRMGADVVEANHPYANYGYFGSLDQGLVPGGYDDGYDLVEVQPGDNEANDKTIARVWELWNEGKRKYLAAGSDVHDVWLQQSGSSRTFVHVDGELTVDKFIAALKAGHSYASQGPLIYPEMMFGSELLAGSGDELRLNFQVEAARGVRVIRLVERGKVIEERVLGNTGLIDVEFLVRPREDTWYSLVVKDLHALGAYSNPVWVTVSE